MVNRTQYGGTLALAGGDRGKAMEDAHRKMAEHCGPGNYTIIREGETVIGQDSSAASETRQEKDGTVVQEAGSSTRDAVEWRIEYQCGNVAPAPMGPTAPPGPPPPPPGPPPGRI